MVRFRFQQRPLVAVLGTEGTGARIAAERQGRGEGRGGVPRWEEGGLGEVTGPRISSHTWEPD